MLAPTPTRPDITADFESLLAAARLEALAVLRAHLTADPDTPAHTLRERRLAATAILRIDLPKTEPRAQARGPAFPSVTPPARQQGVSSSGSSAPTTPPPAESPAPDEPRARARGPSGPATHITAPPIRAPKKSRRSIYARVQDRLKSAAPQTASTSG